MKKLARSRKIYFPGSAPMTNQQQGRIRQSVYRWGIGALGSLAMSVAFAAPGAIWTSLINGSTVNSNLYDSKGDVYLNGGPNNSSGVTSLPNGDYYFHVTDRSQHALPS